MLQPVLTGRSTETAIKSDCTLTMGGPSGNEAIGVQRLPFFSLPLFFSPPRTLYLSPRSLSRLHTHSISHFLSPPLSPPLWLAHFLCLSSPLCGLNTSSHLTSSGHEIRFSSELRRPQVHSLSLQAMASETGPRFRETRKERARASEIVC